MRWPNYIQQALKNLNTKDVSEQMLILQTHEGELRLVLKAIIRIKGERNYSYVHLANKKKKLVTKTLGEMEELLDDKGFFRCHRSHLINGFHILTPAKKFSVNLSDGVEIPVARRKRETFKAWLKKLEH